MKYTYFVVLIFSSFFCLILAENRVYATNEGLICVLSEKNIDYNYTTEKYRLDSCIKIKGNVVVYSTVSNCMRPRLVIFVGSVKSNIDIPIVLNYRKDNMYQGEIDIPFENYQYIINDNNIWFSFFDLEKNSKIKIYCYAVYNEIKKRHCPCCDCDKKCYKNK